MNQIQAIRKDFPILQKEEYIYFDNAATTQRPVQVMDAIRDFYENANANPLRGLYDWSIDATERYEHARQTVAEFLHANRSEEIVFTRNTTESLNLVAYSYGLQNLQAGDEIVLSVMEHHSNLLPWQMVAKQTGAKIVCLYPTEDGTIMREELQKKITERTKILALGHVSNVMGVTNPVKEAISLAHQVGAIAVIDGAQAAPHMPVDVQDLDADFYAFSGHKLLGPMGIGVLYGKYALLEEMQPFLRGGEMIEYVTLEDATYAEIPHKFEAGTVNAADAVGLEAAIHYIQNIGFDTIMKQEETLTTRLMEKIKALNYVNIYGSADPAKHSGIVTFAIDGVHPHDVASILNEDKVCIRAGHHCAQPLMQHLGVGSTARASLYFYNTEEEVDAFVDKLSQVRRICGWN